MTNTGGLPAGPFLRARTTRAPRDAGGPPFALSARAKPRIKGGELYLYLDSYVFIIISELTLMLCM